MYLSTHASFYVNFSATSYTSVEYDFIFDFNGAFFDRTMYCNRKGF